MEWLHFEYEFQSALAKESATKTIKWTAANSMPSITTKKCQWMQGKKIDDKIMLFDVFHISNGYSTKTVQYTCEPVLLAQWMDTGYQKPSLRIFYHHFFFLLSSKIWNCFYISKYGIVVGPSIQRIHSLKVLACLTHFGCSQIDWIFENIERARVHPEMELWGHDFVKNEKCLWACLKIAVTKSVRPFKTK